MAEFITDSVELIQRILFDGRKTDELLVLKELIQNADDAVATELDVGICPGLPAATHPLLRGSGLFVVNDGAFEERHARAIRSLGGSSKVEEASAIGKFGIGLKSVFYLGEVFFYLCRSQDDDGSDTLSLAQVLNPWNNGQFGENPRPEWDAFVPEDRRLMRRYLDDQGVPDGFVIWVPLRTKASVTSEGEELSVYQAYPGDEDLADKLFSPKVYRDIVRMLPLMRHLKRIRFLGPNGSVEFDAGDAVRSVYPDLTGKRRFAGQVRGVQAPGTRFQAAEHLLSTPRIDRLRSSPHWPRRRVAGRNRQVDDKTRPHTALVLQQQPQAGNAAVLEIQWASFLPLGDVERVPLGGDVDYHLTLHGCFFISSDRRDVLSWKDAPRFEAENSGQLQQQWNAELARQGTLPLLLPTLSEFVRPLSEEKIRYLSRGLSQSRLFKDDTLRASVCQAGEWVCTVTQGWRLVPPGTRLVPFPKLAGNSGDLLPGWSRLDSLVTVVEQGAPHLLAGQLDRWTNDELRVLFSGIALGKLDTEELKAAKLVLETVQSPENWPARRQILSGILSLEASGLAKHKELFAALVNHVPVQQRFILPKGLARQTRERLALLETDLLVLPGELEVEGQAQFGSKDAVAVLETLAGQKGVTPTITSVLKSTAQKVRSEVRNVAASLPVVEVRELNAKDTIFITPREAFARIAAKSLFRDTDTTRNWLRTLDEVFVDIGVFYTDGSLIDALDGSIASFDITALRHLLRSGTIMRDVEGRKKLLQRLIEEKSVESDPSLVRAVLHGQSKRFDDPSVLLVIDGRQPLLERLAREFLDLRQDGWKIVPLELSRSLNPDQMTLLKVTLVDREEVARLADDAEVSQIPASLFEADERLELLKILPYTLAKKLTFHPTKQGTFTALSPSTILPGNASLPQTLLGDVTFLKGDLRWQQVWETLGVRRLDHAEALRRVLDCPEPHLHTAWILEHLDMLEDDDWTDLAGDITSTCWIGADGVAVAPDQVLVLPELGRTVDHILRNVEDSYYTPEQLPDWVSSHSAFRRLHEQGLTLTGVEAVEALIRIMSQDQNGHYALGDAEPSFEKWWGLFGNFKDELLPGFEIVAKMYEVEPEWARLAFDALQKSLPDHGIVPILAYLTRQSSPQSTERQDYLELHQHYLRQLAKRGLWEQSREQLKLRNVRGQWRPAAELCVGAEGVADRDLLHPREQEVLGDLITPDFLPESYVGVTQADGRASVQQAAKRLEDYFTAWEGLIPDELIGAFSSVLGGDPDVEQFSRMRLGSRELDVIRGIVQEDTRGLPPGLRSFEDWISQTRVTVQISDDDRIWVMSLCDRPLQVNRDTSSPQVLVGRAEPGRFDGKFYVTPLKLNRFDLAAFSHQELAQALLKATRAVLSGMYLIKADRLEDLWKELSASDQFDLLYTQDIIIQDSISYIKHQLSLPGDHPLNDLFRRWESARQREAEERHNPMVKSRGLAGREIETLRQELREAFEKEDPDILLRLLEAVRNRVRTAQYESSSIPFELIQNADDALNELQAMRPGHRVEDMFVVDEQPETLTFMHWGRAVNQFAAPDFDGERQGFKGDLRKMLMLSASDKGTNDMEVTGKFGMGFKTVYLLTDEPQVVSGRLGFQVLGGVYPKQLPAEVSNSIRNDLERYGNRQQGTAIALSVRQEVAEEALRDFRVWLPVLLIFTRKVKQVVDVKGTVERRISWTEVPLLENWFVGSVYPRQDVLERGLVCRLESGDILLPLGSHGLEALPDAVPTLWVTAPTRSFAHAGIAVNADFALDIGRSEVASRPEKNVELADRLGYEFGEALLALYDRSRSWPEMHEGLAIAQAVGPDQFWHGVWELLTAHAPTPTQSVASRLIHRLLWGHADSGMYVLAERRAVTPTGLSGDHDVLTSLKEITHQVSGALGRPGTFAFFGDSATLGLQYPPGTLLHEEIAGRLNLLTGGNVNLPKLRLFDVMKAEFGGQPEIDPQRAALLAGEYTQDFLDSLGDEQVEMQQYLGTFRFESENRSYVPASHLVIASPSAPVSPDERLRAAFAPGERLLRSEYIDKAFDFVVLCRRQLSADSKALAQWARDARDPGSQQAVLTYLLKGELADSLAEALKQDPGWLSGLLTHPAFLAMEMDDRSILAGRLGRAERFHREQPAEQSGNSESEPCRIEDPHSYLNDLYDRWMVNEEWRQRDYEEEIYPAYLRSGAALLPLGDDRRRWMTLFLLGSYQTLGRVSAGSTRNFLEMAQRRGWLDTFSAEKFEPEAWFRIFGEFLEGPDDQQYYHWFSRILATYQLSVHLSTYMQVFQSLGKLKEATGLSAILNLGSSLYTGTGIDAPNLHRTLGIGGHFVLRELLRTGTVHAPHLHHDAYVPSAPVRRHLIALGCPLDSSQWSSGDSNVIYRFLVRHLGEKKATFSGAFDLPFRQEVMPHEPS